MEHAALSSRARIAILASVLLSSMATLAGEAQTRTAGEAATGEPRAPASNAVARGRSLYAHHCSHCHGFNMVNAGNVAFDLRKFPSDDEARFMNSLANGKNGRMPPWAGMLSKQEMEAIWAYVLTRGRP